MTNFSGSISDGGDPPEQWTKGCVARILCFKKPLAMGCCCSISGCLLILAFYYMLVGVTASVLGVTVVSLLADRSRDLYQTQQLALLLHVSSWSKDVSRLISSVSVLAFGTTFWGLIILIVVATRHCIVSKVVYVLKGTVFMLSSIWELFAIGFATYVMATKPWTKPYPPAFAVDSSTGEALSPTMVRNCLIAVYVHMLIWSIVALLIDYYVVKLLWSLYTIFCVGGTGFERKSALQLLQGGNNDVSESIATAADHLEATGAQYGATA